jgi:hypothetical protein
MRHHEPGPLHPPFQLRTMNKQQGMAQVVLCALCRANYRRSKATRRTVAAYSPNPVNIDTILGQVYYQKYPIKTLVMKIRERTCMMRKINQKLYQHRKKFRFRVQYRDVFDPDQRIRLALRRLSARKILIK